MLKGLLQKAALCAALMAVSAIPALADEGDPAPPAPQSGPMPSAQPGCHEPGAILAELKKDFNEAPVFAGAGIQGGALVITSAPHGKTWTALVLVDGHTMCPVGAGTNWAAVSATHKKSGHGPVMQLQPGK